jgi:pre-mRNA-splicing factor SPF27
MLILLLVKALQLIDEETKRYHPNKNYIDYLPPLQLDNFLSPLLKIEMDRLSSRQPMETLSMKRYELPQPSTAQKNDVKAWEDCVNNSYAQLEHQNERIINLELLFQYGSNEWKLHNELLSRMVEQENKVLKSLKNQIQEVNWKRKTEQTKVGAELSDLSNQLVYYDYTVEPLIIDPPR